MDFKTLTYKVESLSNGTKIGILTVQRPEAMNALNKTVLQELKVMVGELEGRREIRALVLTGAGDKAFVAGADIKEMETMSAPMAREMALAGQALLSRLENLPMPTIAAVNGFALGGGLELALSCDFMIASNKAKWGLPEVTLGLIPGYGGTQRLSRCVGKAIAKRVAMSGEMFTAQQGYEWGLFTQLTEPGELMKTATHVAATLSTRAPLAMHWVKESIDKGFDLKLSEGLHIEAEHFARTFETRDHNEGIKAFIEKRPPQFSGS